MASRATLIPIPKNRAVSPDDVNAVYHILNGSYGARSVDRGLGMAVKLWGYDGRLPNGLINTTDYALDVRNRETTQQRAFAARRADNKVVFEVRGGLPYAVINTSALTSPTQVMAFNQPAGGVLGGTYPNPSFALATEYHRVYPKMIVAWYGSNATTLVGGNLELTNAPGWVLCLGQTVTMRDGSVLTTPNMADRYPFGLGGTHSTLGTTIGNSLAGQAAISTSHQHTGGAHTHPQTDHTHQTASHTHGLGSHTHTIPNHFHSMNGHTHNTPAHFHSLNNHTHLTPNHIHSLNGHTHSTPAHFHSLNNHTHPMGSHNHGLSNHSHSMLGHTHTSTIALTTGGPSLVNGLATAGGVNLPQANHTHTVNATVTSGGPDAPNSSTGGPVSNSTDTQSASDTGGSGGQTTPGGGTEGFGTSGGPSPGTTFADGAGTSGGPTPGTTPGGGTEGGGTTDGPSTPLTASDGGGSATSGPSASSDGSGVLTTSAGTTSAVSTGAAAFTTQTGFSGPTINATPPSLGWWWIMKL